MREEKQSIEETFIEKVWKVIKFVLLVVTFPVWFPWKLLFVRKDGKKFSEVDSKTQLYRVLRSPITKTLKFCVFLFIIVLEIFIVHKIRYSPITYPFTRNAVMNYYLNENRIEIEGVEEDYRDDFQIAFDYIDTWSLDEKNKIHNILNSDLMKYSIKYTDNETVYYILNKFNTDVSFRENVRSFVRNINENVSRFIKEMPEEDFNRLNSFLGPIITVSSWAIDYGGALDIGGAVFKWAVDKYSISEKSLHVTSISLEKAFQTGIDFNDGKSLQVVTSYWK